MEQGVLIAGKGSPFYAALVQEALRRSFSILAARDGEAESGSDAPEEPGEEPGERLTYVPWERRSLVSARTVLLQAEQHDLTDIVLCVSPEGVHSPFHQTKSVLIEERVDAALKGYLFFVKESLSMLLRRGGGKLSFVLFDGGAEIMAPVDAMIRSALVGFFESLFSFYEAEPVEIRALHASDADRKAMAEWAFSLVTDGKSEGRWVRYGQRGGLFGIRK